MAYPENMMLDKNLFCDVAIGNLLMPHDKNVDSSMRQIYSNGI
jgi:hypothetical protein